VQVIAPLYAKVLEQAAKDLGPGPAYALLWPAGNLRAPWTLAVERLYHEVRHAFGRHCFEVIYHLTQHVADVEDLLALSMLMQQMMKHRQIVTEPRPCVRSHADQNHSSQVAKLRIVPSSMSAPGDKPAWLRPDEVLFLDDAVARCSALLTP